MLKSLFTNARKKLPQFKLRLAPSRKRYLAMTASMLSTLLMIWSCEAWYSKDMVLIVAGVLHLIPILLCVFSKREDMKPILCCSALILPAVIGFTIPSTILFPFIALSGCMTGAIGIIKRSDKLKMIFITGLLTISFPAVAMADSFFIIKSPPVWLPFVIVFMATLTLYLIEAIGQDEIKKAQKAVSLANSKANHDKLTGLLNRQTLEAAVDSLGRLPGTFSLIMMDIDNFKKVNDTYGHAAGDAVLAGLAKCLKQSIRDGDKAFRYGGEEFCVLCPSDDAEKAAVVAERIRINFNKQEYNFTGSPVHFSISMGVSDCRYTEYENLVKLVEKSDSALYEAKHNGKNRVEIYPRQ